MPHRKDSLSEAFSRPVGLWLIGCGMFVLISHATAQSFQDSERDFLHGHYDEVIKTATKKVADDDYSGDWRLLLVKALVTEGRYADAHTNALAALNDYSGLLEKRLLARETFLFQNDPDGANQQLADMQQLIETRSGQLRNQEPVALGRALLLLGVEPRLVLENCFQPSRKTAIRRQCGKRFWRAGQLALDKHDFALAADAFRAGLKKFSDDPDLETGLAHAFEPSDRAEMLTAIQAALAVNPGAHSEFAAAGRPFD